MIKKSLVLMLLFLLSLASFANGSSVYTISSVTRSSDPIFKDVKDVSIISEVLHIKLLGDRSKVSVTYILWNNSDNDHLNIDYGFPIDYVRDHESEEEDAGFLWRDSYLQDIVFMQDSELLEAVSSEGVPLANREGDEWLGEMYRKWFYTQISIRKQSFITLKVEYSLANGATGEGILSGGYIPYYNQYFKYRLNYDFSPASHWGDGIIRDFSVRIDASELQLVFEDEGDEEIDVEGLDFEKTNKVYTYKERNFDLGKSKSLSIDYLIEQPLYMDVLMKHKLENDKYIVKASSEKTDCPVSNLTDMNLESVWMPASKVGKNEYIDFIFEKPIANLGGFILVNGNQENEIAYSETAKIKKYRLDITYNDGSKKSDEVELDNKTYTQLYFSNLFDKIRHHDFYDTFAPVDNKPIKKFRITILDKYAGTKHDDLCISEIIVLKQ